MGSTCMMFSMLMADLSVEWAWEIMEFGTEQS